MSDDDKEKVNIETFYEELALRDAAARLALGEGTELPELAYRRLRVEDLDEIRRLHEEWFPVRYSAGFYDAAVRERMVGTSEPLYTLVAEDRDTKEIVGLVTAQLTSADACGAGAARYERRPRVQV